MHNTQAKGEHTCVSDRISKLCVLLDHQVKEYGRVQLTEKPNFFLFTKDNDLQMMLLSSKMCKLASNQTSINHIN